MDYNLVLIIMGIVGVSYILLSLLWYTWYLGIGPTASSHTARQTIIPRVLELFEQISQQYSLDKQTHSKQRKPTKLSEPVKVYELGSGWGGLSISLAQELLLYIGKKNRSDLPSQALIKGYELAFVPYLYSKLHWNLRQMCLRLYKAQVTQQVQVSFQNTDFISSIVGFEPQSILIAYLCPKQMQRIAESLQEIDEPLGIYLLSLTFALPGHQAVRMERLPTLFKDPLYLYLI